ncbi:MAG: hypothetical protein ABII22_03595, partial [Candidatus Micrarchaeota archaeon]
MKRIIILLLILGLVNSVSVEWPGKVNFLSNGSGVIKANITIYSITFGQYGPEKSIVNSSIANYSGNYNASIPAINPAGMYTLRVLKFNESNTVQATHISPTLPELPYQFFISAVNNTNISLVNASTIYIDATNETSLGGQTNFSGLFFEDMAGFPIDEWATQVTNKTIYVQNDKNYTLTVMRFGQNGPGIMPRSIRILSSNLTTPSQWTSGTYNATFNITQKIIWVGGNLTFIGNTSPANFTTIVAYPSAGPFTHINHGQMYNGSWGVPDPTGVSNETAIRVELHRSTALVDYFAYNFTIPSADTGINYLLVAYGNDSNFYYAGFQNITARTGSNLTINISMKKLIGNYSATSDPFSDISTVKYPLLASYNSSIITTSGGEAKIEYSGYSNDQGNVSVSFATSSDTSGTFWFPMITGYNATVSIFNQNYAPIKKSINTSSNGTIVFLKSMEFGP